MKLKWRDVTTEAKLLLVGIPVLLWTIIPVYHMFLFAISERDQATSGRLWPKNPTLQNFEMVFQQQHFYLNHFWLQLGNSLWIAVAVGVITLFIATTAAFAISRLKVPGGRTVMNLALFTYFIPAAFLAVPMYKTMATYGLLNNRWSLVLAMVTIASPYCIWVLKQASRQAALGAGRGRAHRRRHAAAAVPPGLPAADGAVAGGGGHLCAAAGLERVPVRLPAAVQREAPDAGRGAGQLPRGRRFTLGAADGHRLHLRAAAGGDLLRLQALHGVGPDSRRREIR